MTDQLDYVIDVPVDTLIVTSDPSQPAIFTNTSEVEAIVQQSAYPATNAMIEYLQKHSSGIFMSEMNIGLQEDAKRLLAANKKVSDAQSTLSDAKNAYENSQKNGTIYQIAEAKLNYLNAQKNLYQTRNEMRRVSSEMMSQQILYNNGLIGFGVVPDGESPNTLNNISGNYQEQIYQMQQATSKEVIYIDKINANINKTTSNIHSVNTGGYGGSSHFLMKQGYAPPLFWGPWIDLAQHVGRDVYTISFDTLSDTPSTFDVQIEYATENQMKSISTMGPGEYQITDNNGAGTDRIRFKSHSVGQNIQINY